MCWFHHQSEKRTLHHRSCHRCCLILDCVDHLTHNILRILQPWEFGSGGVIGFWDLAKARLYAAAAASSSGNHSNPPIAFSTKDRNRRLVLRRKAVSRSIFSELRCPKARSHLTGAEALVNR